MEAVGIVSHRHHLEIYMFVRTVCMFSDSCIYSEHLIHSREQKNTQNNENDKPCSKSYEINIFVEYSRKLTIPKF